MHNIFTGDVLDILPSLQENSFDACLTDPPYGLTFMGSAWDKGVPSSTIWSEVLRVLKPGAHMLAFGGTRTFHRLTTAIEDAGFEIHDCLMWLYGTGFPKSLDVSKAIDKAAGAERQIVAERTRGGFNGTDSGLRWGFQNQFTVTAPATEEAKRFSGYGTALKPAWEPCILAMKPTDRTFAHNAIAHGIAGLNIDGTRIGNEVRFNPPAGNHDNGHSLNMAKYGMPADANGTVAVGRWPANLILDDSFTHQWSRFFYQAKASTNERTTGTTNGNNHPCVKPLDLTRYLAQLMLPPAGETPRQLLVPFSGSGSEMIGGLLAGWDEVVGIEKEPEYVAIAQERLAQFCLDY